MGRNASSDPSLPPGRKRFWPRRLLSRIKGEIFGDKLSQRYNWEILTAVPDKQKPIGLGRQYPGTSLWGIFRKLPDSPVRPRGST